MWHFAQVTRSMELAKNGQNSKTALTKQTLQLETYLDLIFIGNSIWFNLGLY